MASSGTAARSISTLTLSMTSSPWMTLSALVESRSKKHSTALSVSSLTRRPCVTRSFFSRASFLSKVDTFRAVYRNDPARRMLLT